MGSAFRAICARRTGLALFSLVAGLAVQGPSVAAVHPLDPLSGEEMAATVQLLKAEGRTGADSRFALLVLHEPPKEEVLRFEPGGAMRREAAVVVFDRATHQTFGGIVDLKERRILSWTEKSGVQPPIMGDDAALAAQIVRADPQWQSAIRKRGITEPRDVQIDPWPAGYFGIDGEDGIRIVRAISYFRGGTKNYHARPIEGVVADVDLKARKVLRLVDTGVLPVPEAAEFDAAAVGKSRPAPKALQIVQPQGVSFEVRGSEVRWQNWRFRFAMHPREGLVLYTVGYEDAGKLRPILYRASLSEMVVPYGDPSPAWFFRNTFDAGELGLGRSANSLQPLTDAPNNAVFLDVVLADDRGTPRELPRAVAVFERDGGILWKHRDPVSGANEARRARELVLSWITTVGNYDYGFNWIFHQDGTLELEALLTGIMAAKGVADEAAAAPAGGDGHELHAHRVGRNVAAVHHQHFFNFRLDFDVDGSGNSIVEMNTEALPAGPDNPYSNAFTMRETLLRTEQEARRQVSLAASRKWKVINPSERNALGQPVGYMLVPGENAVPYAAPGSWVRKRAGFLDAHLWVTPSDGSQMHAAGEYPNQSKGGEGLATWVQANRSIENQDIVLWYTMGITHIPRPEEWPVMPVHRAGFRLVPAGFFSRNPALDVPKPD